MGIPGLLRALTPGMRGVRVNEFRGLRAAIDGNAWLYRACYSCATELAMGIPTDKYVHFFMRRIQLLKQNDVEPVVVFDGAKPQLKLEVEDTRNRNSEHHREKGRKVYNEAKSIQESDSEKAEKLFKEADQHFQKAIRIQPELIRRLVDGLKFQGFECTVAPYEADAQLAWMIRNERADLVITEDSDIPVFLCAAKCSCKVLFKMDSEGNGQCLHVRANEIHKTMGPLVGISRPQASKSKPSSGFLKTLSDFTPRMFVQMAVLAGCDYVESLPSIAVLTAANYISKYRSVNDNWRLRQIVSYLKGFSKISIPEDYETRLVKAEACFRHHLVYNLNEKKIEPLTTIPTIKFRPFSEDQCSTNEEPPISVDEEFLADTPAPASRSSKRACKKTSDPREASLFQTNADVIEILDTDEECHVCTKEDYPKRSTADSETVLHESWSFLGTVHDPHIATSIAEGKLHPSNKSRISPMKGEVSRTHNENSKGHTSTTTMTTTSTRGSRVAKTLEFSTEATKQPDTRKRGSNITRSSTSNKRQKSSLRSYMVPKSRPAEMDTSVPEELQSAVFVDQPAAERNSSSPKNLFEKLLGAGKRPT
eukprot:gb/GECG01007346.1/.p1 GENE.gb/GECG01007346.1/~~gb/GECG01007346.1/.p1  ORF type:complete len:593 (+),score=70.20 gb/GECG01007346.1/:1-1779(+)